MTFAGGRKTFCAGLFALVLASSGCKSCSLGGPGGYTSHTPPESIKAGQRTKLVWEFHGEGHISEVRCHYRAAGEEKFRTLSVPLMGRQGQWDVYECYLPAFGDEVSAVEYYFDSRSDGVCTKDTKVISVPVSPSKKAPAKK